jgi:DNA-binding NarL/FixJ family response regulator
MRLDRVLNPKMRRPITEVTQIALAQALEWSLRDFEETVLGVAEAPTGELRINLHTVQRAQGTLAPHHPHASSNRGASRTRHCDAERFRIVVVDDHRFMREVIIGMLHRHARYDVVAEAENVRTAIAECARLKPDVVILDINLPDGSGIEAVADVARASPATRILLCTAGVTDDRILDALRSGALGFVEKTNTWNDFIEALEHVAAGEQYFCARSSAALARFLKSEGNSASPNQGQI